MYVDCDVEEPNGHLFLKPLDISEREVSVPLPVVDTDKCIGCRKCVEVCAFNALAFVKNKVKIFPEICHSCGGCVLLCPKEAITETDKVVGKVQTGQSGDIKVYSGIMNAGEASGVPIIKELLELTRDEDGPIFIDCPPGSACIVMESIKDADYCILVAEPTVFGVHNLGMVYELVSLFGKRHGVVLNKCMDGENPARDFCDANNIPVVGSIPFDTRLGTISSNAEIAVRESEDWRRLFSSLLDTVLKEAGHEAALNPER